MTIRRKIIFLNNYPLDDRDVKRFGLEILPTIGFDVEIWDVSHFYYSYLDKISSFKLKDSRISVSKLDTLNQARHKVTGIAGDDVVIIAGTTLKIVSIKTLILHILLNSTQATYGAVLWGDHPVHLSRINSSHAKKNFLLVSFNFGKKLFKKKYLTSTLWREFDNSVLIGKTLQALRIFKPLHIIWLGTLINRIPKRCIGSNTQLKHVHNFDYDRFLETNEIFAIAADKPVFLDSMGPLHTDYIVESRNSVTNIEEYANLVNEFFDKFEAETGSEIIIAAHPRSNRKIAEQLYGNRKVFFDKTPELIRGSSLVISIDGGTAIGFAVLWKKPLIILNSMKLDLEIQEFNKLFVALLAPTKINLDNHYSIPHIAPINVDLYEIYKETYIKKKGTPNKLFWNVVAEDIKNH